MKNILFLLIAILIYSNVTAQLPNNSIYLRNGVWGSKTTSSTACECDLQSVLNNGNFADKNIIIEGILGKTEIYQGAVICQDAIMNKIAKITTYSGIPTLTLQDETSPHFSYFQSGNISVSRVFKTPNHDGELVTNNGGDDTQAFPTGTTSMTIVHGLGRIPDRIFINIYSPSPCYGQVTSRTFTTFTVTFPITIFGAITIDWQAF